MGDTFHIKRRDTAPSLRLALTEGFGAPINLTGASVRFLMASTKTGDLTVNASAEILGNPEDGVVQYSWAVGDTENAGRFHGEFEVTYSAGGVETFPNTGYISIVVEKDLG